MATDLSVSIEKLKCSDTVQSRMAKVYKIRFTLDGVICDTQYFEPSEYDADKILSVMDNTPAVNILNAREKEANESEEEAVAVPVSEIP